MGFTLLTYGCGEGAGLVLYFLLIVVGNGFHFEMGWVRWKKCSLRQSLIRIRTLQQLRIIKAAALGSKSVKSSHVTPTPLRKLSKYAEQLFYRKWKRRLCRDT